MFSSQVFSCKFSSFLSDTSGQLLTVNSFIKGVPIIQNASERDLRKGTEILAKVVFIFHHSIQHDGASGYTFYNEVRLSSRHASGSFRKFSEQKAGQKIFGRTLESMLKSPTLERTLKSPDLPGRVSICTSNSLIL